MKVKQMSDQFDQNAGDQISVFRAFTDGDYLKASWICAGLSFSMHFTGLNFVIVFSTMLIEKLNESHPLSAVNPGLSSGIIGIFTLLGPFVSIKVF